MAKKIKNVFQQQSVGRVFISNFIHVQETEIIDSDKLSPKILVNSRYGILDIKNTKAPFTNKVKRLARDKQKSK